MTLTDNALLSTEEAQLLSAVKGGEDQAALKRAAQRVIGASPAEIESVDRIDEGVRVTVAGKPSTVTGGVDQGNASRPVAWIVADADHPDAFGRIGLMALTAIPGSRVPPYLAPVGDSPFGPIDATVESITRDIAVCKRRRVDIPDELARCTTEAGL